MNNVPNPTQASPKLIKTIHESNKIVEVYLDDDTKSVKEVVFLPQNRVKKYHYTLSEYSSRGYITL